jgi:hypothetical protein
MEWFEKLPPTSQAVIIGAIIGAGISVLTTILTIIFKDYLLSFISEKRSLKNKRSQAFKDYSNPLILSSISFLFRTKELFERGFYLLNDAPKNHFNEYKYLSTLYRICSLLGWIRAINIELSHIEVQNTKKFSKIEKALQNFEKSLADGEHIELLRLQEFCKIWSLPFDEISAHNKKFLGTQIEIIIDKSTFQRNVNTPCKLDKDKMFILVRTVADLICSKLKNSVLSDSFLSEKLNMAIQAMSRIEAWIYRDWQSAIGDLMLKPNSSTQRRKYDIISYLEFENLCFNGDPNSKKWLNRIESLFLNLDISIEDKFDARKQQLLNCYNAVVSLVETFSNEGNSNPDLAKNNLPLLKNKL